MKILGFFIILFLLSNTFAADYFDGHSTGWHWYQQDPEKSKQTKSASITPESATTQLAQLQQTVSEAKATAVLYPTQENIMHYIALQNALTAQASLFAKNWQEVIRINPTLDFSLQHPTNQTAKQAQAERENDGNDLLLKQAASKYGLFFFFEGKCPYCQKLSPILLQTAQSYGFNILPVSLDGLSLPEFSHPQMNNGQAESLGVKVFPSVYLVSPNSRTISPVTFGLVSEVELKERLVTAIKELQTHE